MKHKKAQWPWHVLTVLVLVGLAGALYYATSLMSYEWRWNRVPQYFAYHAEETQRATDISTVTELVRKGSSAVVTLRNDAGDEQHLTVDENSLQVARGDDVAEGDVIGVKVAGRDIALYEVDGTIYATDNVCTHGAARLSDGFLEDGEIECPLHQGRFDVCTGKAMCAPLTEDIKTYPVKIENMRVMLRLD